MSIFATENVPLNVILFIKETLHAIKALEYVRNAKMAFLAIDAKLLVPRTALESAISLLENAISAKWASLAKTALKSVLRIACLVNVILNWVIARVDVQVLIMASFVIKARVRIKPNMTPLQLFLSFLGFWACNMVIRVLGKNVISQPTEGRGRLTQYEKLDKKVCLII
ncbi:hypothetical protein MIR68_005217 [Amoeboaphelidium protococcarum]|nr:hypothetical protein MIR68_005217 [Amoeboaphelidium protococcarum]